MQANYHRKRHNICLVTKYEQNHSSVGNFLCAHTTSIPKRVYKIWMSELKQSIQARMGSESHTIKFFILSNKVAHCMNFYNFLR